MYSQILNSLGLLMEIVGAGILFKYGFPQPSFEEGVSLGLEGPDIDRHNEMVFVGLGFLFQFVSIWI